MLRKVFVALLKSLIYNGENKSDNLIATFILTVVII